MNPSSNNSILPPTETTLVDEITATTSGIDVHNQEGVSHRNKVSSSQFENANGNNLKGFQSTGSCFNLESSDFEFAKLKDEVDIVKDPRDSRRSISWQQDEDGKCTSKGNGNDIRMVPPLKKRLSFGYGKVGQNPPEVLTHPGASFNPISSKKNRNLTSSRPPSRVSFALPETLDSYADDIENNDPSLPASTDRHHRNFQTPKMKQNFAGSLGGSLSSASSFTIPTTASKGNHLLSEPLLDTPFPKLYYGNLGLEPSRANTSPPQAFVSGTRTIDIGGVSDTVNAPAGHPGAIKSFNLPGQPHHFVTGSNDLAAANSLASLHAAPIFSVQSGGGSNRLFAPYSTAYNPTSAFSLSRAVLQGRTAEAIPIVAVPGKPLPVTGKAPAAAAEQQRFYPQVPEIEISNVLLDGQVIKVRRVIDQSSILSSKNAQATIQSFVTVPDEQAQPHQPPTSNQRSKSISTSPINSKSKTNANPLHTNGPVNTPRLDLKSIIFPEAKTSIASKRSLVVDQSGCICKRSRCLKLYCKCFQTSTYCDEIRCKCKDCSNTRESDVPGGDRRIAISEILKRRPDAFSTRPIKKTGEGCSCKKNRCLKKYCDCYALGKKCTDAKCSCIGCENGRTKIAFKLKGQSSAQQEQLDSFMRDTQKASSKAQLGLSSEFYQL